MKKIYLTIICIGVALWDLYGQGSPSNLPADISGTTQTVSPTAAQNYILAYTYLEGFESHPGILYTGDASPEIQYFDGLGRPSQTVSVKGTQQGNDILTYQHYDAYGRPDKTYLPFAKSSNNGAYLAESSFISQQNTFLTGIYGSTDGSKGYAVTEYENSPLNRALKQGAPGDAWQPTAHPVSYAYKTNASAVASWKYSGDSYSAFNYNATTLYLTETTDEDGKMVKEYRDKEEKIVRREVGTAITRYCYDDFGLLRCVVQPAGSSPASTDYCFYYKYDGRQRMTEKYIPGGTWTYYIYDARDRLVLSQDGNQRAKPTPEWTYTVYDPVNRPIEQGSFATSTARSSLVSIFELAANLNYLAGQSKTALKYLHYDNYTGCPAANAWYTADASALGVSQAAANTGRLTWTETKALDYEAGMDYWLTSSVYYDKYGRAIQTVSDNHLNGIDYITNKYNFAGQPERTRHRHVADAVTTYTDQYMDYDHRGRLLKTRYQINGGTETLLAGNSYYETGQLADKYLHSQSGGNFLQRMDYTYNIRGWLTQIDDPTSFSENDKFGLQLYYNTAPSGGTALYNGNIGGMKWGTPANSNLLYRFTYDGLNRLTNADFDKSGYAAGAFDCTYSYDANGNTASINRKKLNGAYSDQLTYNYTGNRLNYVNDASGDVPNVVDYPGTSGSYTFAYDANGNMAFEPNKSLTVAYNLLSLPKQADFGSNRKINYFYTFDGVKLRQVVENSGTLTKVDYCGPFVYETLSGTRSLKYIVTPEGRAVKNGSNWEHEYNLKDHLGNTRTVIKNNGGVAQVVQERHYYSFGMEMSELGSGSSSNKYLYNGKEFQNDLGLDWYDYGARFYDPQIARWHVVDPLVEDDDSWSPYNYVRNNPISHNDPDGRFWNYVGGALLGAGVDYVGQVAANLATGSDLSDALTDVNVGSILISAGEGALTSGASVFSSAAKTGVKMTAKVVAKEAVKEGLKEGAGKVIDNAIKGKDLAEGVVQEATVGAVAKTVSVKNTNYSDKQKVVNRIESKANPTHRQQNIAKTNNSQIKATQVSNTAKTTTNTTVKNTANNVVNKVKEDEKK